MDEGGGTFEARSQRKKGASARQSPAKPARLLRPQIDTTLPRPHLPLPEVFQACPFLIPSPTQESTIRSDVFTIDRRSQQYAQRDVGQVRQAEARSAQTPTVPANPDPSPEAPDWDGETSKVTSISGCWPQSPPRDQAFGISAITMAVHHTQSIDCRVADTLCWLELARSCPAPIPRALQTAAILPEILVCSKKWNDTHNTYALSSPAQALCGGHWKGDVA